MILPSQAWCIQLDIQTHCHLACSNCTRLLTHAPNFRFSLETFKKAIDSVYTFPTASDPCPKGRRKVVGLIGGEPLLHKDIGEMIDYMCAKIPNPAHRGLWTSLDWLTYENKKGPVRPLVEKLLGLPPGHDGGGLGAVHGKHHKHGYLNWNMHLPADNCHHQPLLVSGNSIVRKDDGSVDMKTLWDLIDDCWVQREWSPTFTGQGFYFCEVSAHFDYNFDQNHAIPFGHECWRGDLKFYTTPEGHRQPVVAEADRDETIGTHAHQGGCKTFGQQVLAHCGRRCGACIPMPGRLDSEEKDDISQDNYDELVEVGKLNPKKASRAIRDGNVVVLDPAVRFDPANAAGWFPNRYKKGLPIVDGELVPSLAGSTNKSAPASYPVTAPHVVESPKPAAAPAAPPAESPKRAGQIGVPPGYQRVSQIVTLPNGQRAKRFFNVLKKK